MFKKGSNNRGFTLIEIMVVIVILGILVSYVAVRMTGRTDEARQLKARMDITSLETALELYKLDNGSYPTTEQGIMALIEAPSVGKLPRKWRKGGYLKKSTIPKDPWGNEYIYLSPGLHGTLDIMSYGDDGGEGGEDKDMDINNWEIE